jgi:hypothetical protein
MQVHEMATEYTYAALPEGHRSRRYFTVHVRYRGAGTWAVMLGERECLGADGRWDYEPSPSNREDDWLATHRFDLATAQRLAREVAPKLSVNGWTLDRVLAHDAKEER